MDYLPLLARILPIVKCRMCLRVGHLSFQTQSQRSQVKDHSRAHDLGDPVEQVLREFQDSVEDRMANLQAQLEDALESKEKVIFLIFLLMPVISQVEPSMSLLRCAVFACMLD